MMLLPSSVSNGAAQKDTTIMKTQPNTNVTGMKRCTCRKQIKGAGFHSCLTSGDKRHVLVNSCSDNFPINADMVRKSVCSRYCSWPSAADEKSFVLRETLNLDSTIWQLLLHEWSTHKEDVTVFSLFVVYLTKQMCWEHSGSKERWKTVVEQGNIPTMKEKQRAVLSVKHHSLLSWKHSMVPLPNE